MPAFGDPIRTLRQHRNLPLHVVATAVGIDSTRLSRLELGERFSTNEQLRRFADYFALPAKELAARAVTMLRERLSDYGNLPVDNDSKPASETYGLPGIPRYEGGERRWLLQRR